MLSANTLQPRAIWLVFANTVLTTLLGGCIFGGGGKLQTLRASPGVPSSEGTVRTPLDDNGNTKLEIRIKHLPHPSKVAPDATVYVVWVQPGSETNQNVGALKVNDDLEASLDSITPFRRFALTITPEPSFRGARPTHDAVFTADVDPGGD